MSEVSVNGLIEPVPYLIVTIADVCYLCV